MIGRSGERGTGISLLVARHDDDDDDDDDIYTRQHFFIDTYLIEHYRHFSFSCFLLKLSYSKMFKINRTIYIT